MKIRTRISISKEGEKQTRIEPTIEGYDIIVPIPKNSLIALLNGDVRSLYLE